RIGRLRVGRRRRALPVLLRRLALAVVGRVEARALVVDRDRVEDELERRGLADVAAVGRRRGHRLEALEDVAVRAAILVDRHGVLRVIRALVGAALFLEQELPEARRLFERRQTRRVGGWAGQLGAGARCIAKGGDDTTGELLAR